jgi:hypothetical protein
MRTLATMLILAGVTATSAQAQMTDSVPIGPRDSALVLLGDSVNTRLMALVPLLKCPMPVSRGVSRDSLAVVRPQEHAAPSQKPVAIPTQRANCVNPMFVSGADR